MSQLKIRMVKFYQGVNIDMKTNMNSMSVVEKRDVQNKQLVSIEKTAIGVLIKTEDVTGRIGYTEIPFNNLAYINYEPGQVEESGTTKPKTK